MSRALKMQKWLSLMATYATRFGGGPNSVPQNSDWTDGAFCFAEVVGLGDKRRLEKNLMVEQSRQ